MRFCGIIQKVFFKLILNWPNVLQHLVGCGEVLTFSAIRWFTKNIHSVSQRGLNERCTGEMNLTHTHRKRVSEPEETQQQVVMTWLLGTNVFHTNNKLSIRTDVWVQ